MCISVKTTYQWAIKRQKNVYFSNEPLDSLDQHDINYLYMSLFCFACISSFLVIIIIKLMGKNHSKAEIELSEQTSPITILTPL